LGRWEPRSRAEAPQSEQKPDVLSELGTGNDEALGNHEPTRRMPSSKGGIQEGGEGGH
jgi:hypothetical protein